jgi:protein-S-isoprenylcysteine O-methyltransferase Ste14
MSRTAALIYGFICYVVFFLAFLYLVGFLGNLAVPKSVDSGTAGPLGAALLTDTLLLVLFGVQHSVMARPGFKAWWTRLVPRPIERSTYVLASSLALALLFWLWQPASAPVWQVEGGTARMVLRGLFFAGVGTVLYATFLIDHFDLFGLRQVVLYWRGLPYEDKRFTTPGPYRWIRHPLYVGWLTTVWATPVMSAGHFLFALVMTAYILVAIPLEERDLSALLGEPYRRYRDRTPLFVPRPRVGGLADRPTRTATPSS